MSNQPILILHNHESPNRFASYLTEILDTEGFFCRDFIDLSQSSFDERLLLDYDVVILTNVPVDPANQESLSEYVRKGGNLIALRPPVEMSEIFGLSPARSVVRTFREGFVTLNESHPLAARLGVESLQFHDTADLYDPRGAEALAWVVGKPGVKTHYPAVSLHAWGEGLAGAFTFDLAACTVLFHQGNRLNSSLGPNPDPNEDRCYKPDDLFYKFLDERFKTLPQADLYADLLVLLIRHMSHRKKPLPRVWHYPDAAPSVAFMDGDSDTMTTEDLEKVIELVERVDGKYTIYLMPGQYEALSPERSRELRSRGHDLGPHPFAGRMPGPEESAENLAKEVAALTSRYDYAPVAQRGHSVVWVGWTEHAGELLKNGLRLDTNFCAGPGFQYGYLSGSGLPVRFVDAEGRIIDVYEQATISMEDGWYTEKTLLPAMTVEECTQLSLTQIDEAAEKYHTVYHPCFHPAYVRDKDKSSIPWIEAVAAHLQARGIPFVNGREWLEFNDARRTLRFEELKWDPVTGVLQFGVTAKRDISGLTILLPAFFQQKQARVVGDSSKIVDLERHLQLAIVLNLQAGTQQQVQVTYA